MDPSDTAFPGLQGMLRRRRELMAELTGARRESGLSQTEIAARMGTSQSAVARIEHGDADVRVSTLERYAAALNRTVEWRVHSREEDE